MVNVNYGVYHPLLAKDLVRKLMTREHPLGANLAYPTLLTHPVNGNYEQIICKKRFNDLILKYKDATNNGEMPPENFINYISQNLLVHGAFSVMHSCAIETPYREELAKLAIDIVCEDFNIKEGDVIFNVKIVGLGEVKFPESMKMDEESAFDAPEMNDDNDMHDPNEEVQKRKFINALISGASKKGHYIFHLGREKLNQINGNLIPLYQILMSANDLSYFAVSENILKMAASDEHPEGKAGFEKITFDEDGKPIITVEAVNFPTVLHELIKAVLELIATLALPDNKELVEYIYDNADYLKAETWYLRLGPVLWERLIDCFPPEYAYIKAQLLGKIFEQPTAEFNSFMRLALSTETQEQAKSLLSEWSKEISENIRSYNQDNL